MKRATPDTAAPPPARARGDRLLLWELKDQVARDRLSIVAAGVAFYALLAVVPALAALVAIYGLVFDPQQVSRQIAALSGLLPPQALDILLGELQNLARIDRGSLGWGAAVGLALTLWSASKGVKTLLEALNVAYGERETRGFIRLNALALLLTLGAIVTAALAIAAIVVIPAVVAFVGLDDQLGGLVAYARWPILAAAAAGGIAVLYRYGPSRAAPSWSLVAWGAVLATALWLIGSALFSVYVSNFGNFNRTYGSLAALVVLLTWFLLSAYAVLIGAELNAELERRARSASED